MATATRKHSKKAAPAAGNKTKVLRKAKRITEEEHLLLDAFRGIESQHVRNAVLILVADVGWGSLNETADRTSTGGLMREMGVRHA